MIDWDKHDNATCVSVTYFDSNGDAISTSWADRPTQTKTAADAYNAHPLGWDSIDDSYGGSPDGEELVLWDKQYNQFEKGCEGFCKQIFDLVCTRAEFEAYVKEQEGEKWTHTYSDYGVRKDCILVHDKPDIHGQVLVVNRYDEYVLTGTVELKPIKPTISESELLHKIKDMGKGVASNGHFGDTVRCWLDKYDII